MNRILLRRRRATAAEKKVAEELNVRGVPARWIGGKNRFDVMAGANVHVEVKNSSTKRYTSKKGTTVSWNFMLGSNTTVLYGEGGIDFYVFRMAGRPIESRYIVIPAPVGKYNFYVTETTLPDWSQYINAFHLIADAVKKEAHQ